MESGNDLRKPLRLEAKALYPIVLRMLETDPEDRPYAKEVACTLEAFIAYKNKQFGRVLELFKEIETELKIRKSLRDRMYIEVFEKNEIFVVDDKDILSKI